jgi:hypothetical protein
LDCPHYALRVGGRCYYCSKAASGLFDNQSAEGRSLTAEQRLFVGIQDPSTVARWDQAPDLLSHFSRRSRYNLWERGGRNAF